MQWAGLLMKCVIVCENEIDGYECKVIGSGDTNLYAINITLN